MSEIISSSRDVLLNMSGTTSPQKMFPSDCITLYLKNEIHGEINYIFSTTLPCAIWIRIRILLTNDLDLNPEGPGFMLPPPITNQGTVHEFCKTS